MRSQAPSFRLTTFAPGLERPWGMAPLPDGRLLLTERPGRLRIVARDGMVSAPIAHAPQVEARGQGGMLDVALERDFATSREIFLCHAMLVQGGAPTRLTTEGDRVTSEERLLFDRRIRMRQVVVAADGPLLVLTDESRGRVLRLASD